MISNSSPLIILTKIDTINKVKKLYSSIEITKAVYNEVVEKGLKINKEDAKILSALTNDGYIKIIELDEKHKEIVKKIIGNYRIDVGEAEIIALALQKKDREVLIDESLGRKVAKIFDIKPKGTLRILLELHKGKIISEKELKDKVSLIIGKNYRLDAEVLNRFWELFDRIKKS